MDNGRPTTLDEAVERLVRELSDEDMVRVRDTPQDDLILFHHGWGTEIRNSFGLWVGNKALLESCGSGHPDDVSMVIIEAVWRRLQKSDRTNQ